MPSTPSQLPPRDPAVDRHRVAGGATPRPPSTPAASPSPPGLSPSTGGSAKPKLLDRARSELRVRNYSLRTEESYVALMGHKDVSTTMLYTHVLNKGGRWVDSPLYSLPLAGEGDGGR